MVSTHKKMPVIYYSPLRYLVGISLMAVIATAMLVFGFVTKQWIFLMVGFAGLGLSLLFWRVSRFKLRPGAIALSREGGFLVGGELSHPLPVAKTTFEIKSDYEGSWVIYLFCNNQKTVLGAGGWRIRGERHINRAVAERVLVELGIAKLN